MRIYLDSAPVIYDVEGNASYADKVKARVRAADVQPIASAMTWFECRIKPLRERDVPRLQDFKDYFEALYEVLDLTREVVDRAAEIRAEYGFSTPDSIHLGAALVGGCDVFLTNDHRLERFPGIQIDIISAG